MTNLRTNYLYQFQGKILQKRLAIASPNSKYAGQSYYVLSLKLKDQTRKTLQVFRTKLAHDSIWTTIEAGECFSTQYTFYCKNQKGYYYLVDWEKKPSKADSSPQPNKDHELN
jgi:hypothetical protein